MSRKSRRRRALRRQRRESKPTERPPAPAGMNQGRVAAMKYYYRVRVAVELALSLPPPTKDDS